MDKGPKEPFPGLAAPSPPAALRAATLAGARGAMARRPGRDRWRELWESRPIRLAWATAVAALIAANLAVSPRAPSRLSHHAAPTAVENELRSAVAPGDLRAVPPAGASALRLPGGIDPEARVAAPKDKESTT